MSTKSMFSFIVVVFLAAGCASKPVTIETAKPISSHKQFKYAKKSKVRNALLSFIRNNSIIGSTCDSRITVNGERVGDVGTGKIINIYLKPGKHKVTVAPTNTSICGGKEVKSTVRLRRNSEKHFKLALIQDIKLLPVKRAPVEL